MLVRIVRMTFDSDTLGPFLRQFDDTAPEIRAFPGCRHLELWRDRDARHVCTTYSHWENARALEEYRESPLFRSTWATVKPLFSDRPRAYSYEIARSAASIEQASPNREDPNDKQS